MRHETFQGGYISSQSWEDYYRNLKDWPGEPWVMDGAGNWRRETPDSYVVRNRRTLREEILPKLARKVEEPLLDDDQEYRGGRWRPKEQEEDEPEIEWISWMGGRVSKSNLVFIG